MINIDWRTVIISVLISSITALFITNAILKRFLKLLNEQETDLMESIKNRTIEIVKRNQSL